MANYILSASSLNVSYGSQAVLYDLNFALCSDEVCGIIGPNGAGKTTLLRSLYGLVRPARGAILFDNHALPDGDVSARIARQMAYVPQERSVFPNLTVEENLDLAVTSLPQLRQLKREQQKLIVYDLFPRLKERRHQFAGTMSGGEQRMVAVGIGLMMQPRVLLLDEPTTGLAPLVVHNLMDVIHRLNHDHGIATVIVEQNILSMAKIASRIYLIKEGRGSWIDGDPRELTNKQIMESL